VNVTVPFLSAIAVYVNVNVVFVALHHVVALLNVTSPAIFIVISLHARAVVDIHTQSVHVSVIVPDSHAFTYCSLGSHHVHTGFHVSLHVPVYIVFSVKVIAAHGLRVLFHLGVEYHAPVLHIIVVNVLSQLVALFHIVHPVLLAQILDTQVPFTNVAVTSFFVIA
jgi:hypothetical protein